MAQRFFVPVLLIVVAGQTAVGARDLDALAEFLRPAYTAMNFTVLCSQVDPFFLNETLGPRGTPLHFAQHIKDETITGLMEEDAKEVLKAAADAARSKARKKLYELARPGDDQRTATAINEWCQSEVRELIFELIRDHDNDHDRIELFLERAKN